MLIRVPYFSNATANLRRIVSTDFFWFSFTLNVSFYELVKVYNEIAYYISGNSVR